MPVMKCPCGAKLKVPESAAGKRVKCPKCQSALRVPAVAASADAAPAVSAPPMSAGGAAPSRSASPARTTTRAAVQTVPPAPPPIPFNAEAPAADPFSLDEDLMSGVEGGASVPALPALVSAKCPKCGASMTPGTVLCTACGYNTQTGKKVKGAAAPSGGGATSEAARAAAAAAAALGSTMRGTLFCCIGAAIGAAIWTAILVSTGYEVGYVAWALGGLAGAGMAVGSRTETTQNGLIAAAISVGAIIAAKTIYVAMDVVPGAPITAIVPAVIQTMVNPLDALFAGLAVLTAYRLGSNGFELGGGD